MLSCKNATGCDDGMHTYGQVSDRGATEEQERKKQGMQARHVLHIKRHAQIKTQPQAVKTHFVCCHGIC